MHTHIHLGPDHSAFCCQTMIAVPLPPTALRASQVNDSLDGPALGALWGAPDSNIHIYIYIHTHIHIHT